VGKLYVLSRGQIDDQLVEKHTNWLWC